MILKLFDRVQLPVKGKTAEVVWTSLNLDKFSTFSFVFIPFLYTEEDFMNKLSWLGLTRVHCKKKCLYCGISVSINRT